MTSEPRLPHAVSTTVPVVEERLELGRERVTTGAVRVRLDSETVHERVALHEADEQVQVERVARGVPVAERREPWLDGAVLVVPVYEERLVTERRLVLREELRIVRRRTERTGHAELPVQHQRVRIERLGGDGLWHADLGAEPQAVAAGPGVIPTEPGASAPATTSTSSSKET